MASWDGGVVTAAEVRDAVRQLGPGLKEQFDKPQGRVQFIDALVAKRVLAAEARRRGLDRDAELRRQVAELEERLLIQALLAEDARTRPPPDEASLRAFYSEQLESFRQPAAVRVARILLRKSARPVETRGRLERLRARAARGEPLSKLAAEGEGPEKIAGGDIGWLDQPSTPLARAALGLTKVSAPSEIVELDDAFAFVVLLERREARTPPFEEIRELVASRYSPVSQRQQFDQLVKRLFTESGVRITPGALE